MYARYIPPPKSRPKHDVTGDTTRKDVTAQPTQEQPKAISTSAVTTTPYARYIPPKKPTAADPPKRPAVVDQPQQETTQIAGDDKQSKKRKREKLPVETNGDAVEPKKAKKPRVESDILEGVPTNGDGPSHKKSKKPSKERVKPSGDASASKKSKKSHVESIGPSEDIPVDGDEATQKKTKKPTKEREKPPVELNGDAAEQKKSKKSRVESLDLSEDVPMNGDGASRKKSKKSSKENGGRKTSSAERAGLSEKGTGAGGLKSLSSQNGSTQGTVQEGDETTGPRQEQAVPNDVESGAKKAKGEKKKSKKRGEDGKRGETVENPELDKVASRHKSVLERKEKSLEIAKKLARKQGEQAARDGEATNEHEKAGAEAEVHGLEPLPQPAPVPMDTSRPTYETLPSWMSAPIRADEHGMKPFESLGILPAAAKALELKGYPSAFPVQSASIPRLLPTVRYPQGDLLMSAATGSGKTMAYVLPIMQDISQGLMTRLRAIIIMPTRELVRQAHEVCQLCASAYSGAGRKRVLIGVAQGSKAFAVEQAALVETEQVPVGSGRFAQDEPEQAEDGLDEELFRERPRTLPGFKLQHNSKVDVLVCTPGRLVDHINHTPGFTLDYVRWLVIDEADRLLAQSFQQWIDVIQTKLAVHKPGTRVFNGSCTEGVRKIVVSATLTTNLGILSSLRLNKPQLVVGSADGQRADGKRSTDRATDHVLPSLLRESAVKVRDPNLKPLYLVQLLKSEHMVPLGLPSSSNSDGPDSPSDPISSSDPTSSIPLLRHPTTVLIFTKSNESALRLSRLLSLLAPRMLVPPLLATVTSTQRTSERRRILRTFYNQPSSSTLNPCCRVLVASDLVSRGIDLAGLDHVINYDVPTSVESYVHRVGRTARAGRPGRAWTFVEDGTGEEGWFWGGIVKGEDKNARKKAGKKGVLAPETITTDSFVKIDRGNRKVEKVKLFAERWSKRSRMIENGQGLAERWHGVPDDLIEQYEMALKILGEEAKQMRPRKA